MRVTHINPKEAHELVLSPDELTILDVRTAEEFEMSYIEGALNFDVNGDEFKSQLADLDRSKSYLVHCHSGERSEKALKVFESLGFKHIYHLDGGMREWSHAEYPTVYNWFI